MLGSFKVYGATADEDMQQNYNSNELGASYYCRVVNEAAPSLSYLSQELQPAPPL